MSKLLNQDEGGVVWNPYMPIPEGGPLPFDYSTNTPIKYAKSWGSGTLEDPKVMWISDRVVALAYEDPGLVDRSVRFARAMARLWRFSHIWIRKEEHEQHTCRDPVTGMKTRELADGQSHMTVYMGLSASRINVHGHLYTTLTTGPGPARDVGLRLLPRERRWRDPRTGRPGRNPELWKWDVDGTLVKKHRRFEFGTGPVSWRR
ncbi:hypothetical protein F4775DRAFT_595611 [Biscogniauxia sp. FL1348]|nr:hypothetical protein F4775DRAFT_595611 [Biscogniauxia sp. FL1348]